jgi:hypothetical protein
MRKIELKAKKKENKNTLSWVWEFSKKLVLICSVLYVVMFIYAALAMWYFFDFTYLGTFIEQSSDILKTCVFGYFIKAGLENVFKIACSKLGKQTEDESETAAELTPPDGDE